ncbi:transporter substrate-binding domain-containing protein [Rheinheimera riviphila]|uniref:Transporter substrate-binding domain-containing protein n=1 Tax=Rheinheimera riviphila TaxID=1834037 RepID=A0A437R5H3_9GAMM|nr:transporter substrate-binding domain-containing protein [Rheinheimera riviphila]RVU42002.1 transporter substrate-binding domain-containing protein [Rheinheimera riviphila]
MQSGGKRWLGLLLCGICGSFTAAEAVAQSVVEGVAQSVVKSVVKKCPVQIRLPYNSNWLPYIKVTDETITGSDIELIRQVMQDVGSELVLLSMPESRALNDLESGKVDLLFGASYTDARAQFAWFSKPYRHEVDVVIVHPMVLQRYPELTSKTAFFDLARRKLIGTFNPKGFYGAQFEQLKQLEVVQHRSVAIFDAEQRMALVLSQRADFTLVDEASIRLSFDEQPMYQQLQILPFELYRADIHLMLSKKTIDATCVEQINQSLNKIRGRS